MRRLCMRQQLPMDQLPVDREIGFAICRGPDGQLAPGPVAQGHLYGVSIPIACPPAFQPVGTWHTHPGGVPEPSPQDWEMTRRHGLRHLCITVPDTGQTRCYDAR